MWFVLPLSLRTSGASYGLLFETSPLNHKKMLYQPQPHFISFLLYKVKTSYYMYYISPLFVMHFLHQMLHHY